MYMSFFLSLFDSIYACIYVCLHVLRHIYTLSLSLSPSSYPSLYLYISLSLTILIPPPASFNQYGLTALMIASFNGHPAIVTELLQRGAHIDIKDIYAVCIQYLIEKDCVCVCLCFLLGDI